MEVHRLQSPFSHWVSGLGAELLVFGGFIALVAALVAVIVWVF
jgi:hypothetical protein